MDLVNSHGLMVPTMRVTSKATPSMAKASIPGMTVDHMTVIGNSTKCKAMVYLSGMMEGDM